MQASSSTSPDSVLMGLPEGSAAERFQFHTGVTKPEKTRTHLQLRSQCRVALPHLLEDLSSVCLIDTVVLPWGDNVE